MKVIVKSAIAYLVYLQLIVELKCTDIESIIIVLLLMLFLENKSEKINP